VTLFNTNPQWVAPGYTELATLQVSPTLAQWKLPAADMVHLWLANLALPPNVVSKLRQALAPDECERADRFHFERDRTAFVAGRGLLRHLLGRYLGQKPEHIQFVYGTHGKPTLSPIHQTTLQFNLAHTQGVALYAVTDGRTIGVDLEYQRAVSDVESLAARFFSAQEAQMITTLDPDAQQHMFFKFWTCKEAYLKATGQGLAGLEQAQLLVTSSPETGLPQIKGIAMNPSEWCLVQFYPRPAYAAAVAIAGKSCQVLYQNLDTLFGNHGI
jgi:4'-phosphopantetheinyl transferase